MYKVATNLLFSIDKEIAKPSSNVGKVWRIFIQGGILNVGDNIKITSVELEGQPKSVFDIEAEVKSIRGEHDVSIEGVKEIKVATKGSIVGIDVKNCYCNRKKIYKRDINITEQSIGCLSYEKFSYYDEFYIKFVDAEKAFDIVKVGQNVVLLWFGKSISAKVMEIPDSVDGMHIKILYDKQLAIPDSHMLREFFKKIIVSAEHKGEFRYFSGLFEFNQLN